MKITITRADLAEAARAVKGLVARDRLSVFSRVRIDASGCLSVTGSNGEVQVEWRAGRKIAEAGTASVSGEAFAAFAGALPDGNAEIGDCAAGKIMLRCGGVKFKLAKCGVEGFAAMTGPKEAARGAVHIDAGDLREMLRKVKFAMSADATRADLCGVNIELKDGLLGMTATDGRRLAHVECRPRDAGNAPGTAVTLPAKTVAVLYGLLERMGEGDVYMVFDSSAAQITGDKWSMTAKAFAGGYPNWRGVIPKAGSLNHTIRLDRRLFVEAIGRTALASDESSGVEILLDRGRCVFAAKNYITITAAEAEMPVADMDDIKCKFCVNPRLLRDALEAIDDDEFLLHTDCGTVTPLMLTCSAPWKAVVMPYRKEG